MSNSTEPTEALLPCPFCGGEAVADDLGGPDDYFVNCARCDVQQIAKYRSNAAAAIAWNTRATHSTAVRVESESELFLKRQWHQEHERAERLDNEARALHRQLDAALAATPRQESDVDPDELEDIIAEGISTSFDEDWSSRDGARSVIGILKHEGLVIVRQATIASVSDEGEGL